MSHDVWWLFAGVGIVAAVVAAVYGYAAWKTRPKPTWPQVDSALEILRKSSLAIDAQRHKEQGR